MLMKERVAEMEREAEKLRELQAAAESDQMTGDSEGGEVGIISEEAKSLADSRSIYVGNVRAFLSLKPSIRR
jgi:polyadenylate-binding protein 2